MHCENSLEFTNKIVFGTVFHFQTFYSSSSLSFTKKKNRQPSIILVGGRGFGETMRKKKDVNNTFKDCPCFDIIFNH